MVYLWLSDGGLARSLRLDNCDIPGSTSRHFKLRRKYQFRHLAAPSTSGSMIVTHRPLPPVLTTQYVMTMLNGPSHPALTTTYSPFHLEMQILAAEESQTPRTRLSKFGRRLTGPGQPAYQNPRDAQGFSEWLPWLIHWPVTLR